MSQLEQVFVANGLAAPELLSIVVPDFRAFEDDTVKVMLQVALQGDAYTRPNAMLAALESMPQELDGATVYNVLSMIPSSDEVSLDSMLRLKDDIEDAYRDRVFNTKIDRARSLLGTVPAQMVAAEMREALELYDKGALANVDVTTKGALERIRNSPPKTRYKIAHGGPNSPTCDFLDSPFKGLDSLGRPGYGMSGLGEIIILAAPYGVGKTRIMQNWEYSFLQQGASVAHLMLEDDETAGATKLMGIAADLPFWQFEWYLRGEMGFLGGPGESAILASKLNDTVNWYEGLGDRLRIYDGTNTRTNIFNFENAVRMLELDFRLYKTTHLIIDYVQAFANTAKQEDAAEVAQALRALAGRYKVNVLEVAQVSNDTLKWGSAPGQVAAKGAGDWGATAHIGIEIGWSPKVGQRELRLDLKKARNGGRGQVYAALNTNSGKISSYYETPMWMDLDELKPAKKGQRR